MVILIHSLDFFIIYSQNSLKYSIPNDFYRIHFYSGFPFLLYWDRLHSVLFVDTQMHDNNGHWRRWWEEANWDNVNEKAAAARRQRVHKLPKNAWSTISSLEALCSASHHTSVVGQWRTAWAGWLHLVRALLGTPYGTGWSRSRSRRVSIYSREEKRKDPNHFVSPSNDMFRH